MSDPDLKKLEEAKAQFSIKSTLSKHKGKTAAGVAVCIGVALLEAWPMLCPLIPYNLQCGITAPLAKIGAEKLKELDPDKEGQGGGSDE